MQEIFDMYNDAQACGDVACWLEYADWYAYSLMTIFYTLIGSEV